MESVVALVGGVGDWAYLLLFVFIFVETGLLLGVFVPGETLVLLAGFLASRDLLELVPAMAVIAVAAFLGDLVGFWLGRRLGRGWLAEHGRRFGITPSRLERVDRFFSRHVGKAVFLARFVGFARSVAPFAAGSSMVRASRFASYDAAACLLWSSGSVLAGYLLGASWWLLKRWLGQASIVIAGIAAFALGLYLLGRWLSRHEREVRRAWSRVVDRPAIVGAARFLRVPLDAVSARFSPVGSAGVRLAIAIAVLLLASWTLAALGAGVLSGQRLTGVDGEVTSWLVAHSAPEISAIAAAIVTLGSPGVVLAGALIVLLTVLGRRDWFGALAVLLVVPGGLLLGLLFGSVILPILAPEDLPLATRAFPDHVTLGATLLFGVLAALAVRARPGWRQAVTAVLLAVGLVVLVGFSRVYLGVRALSDVLGALLLGLVWLTVCIAAIAPLSAGRVPDSGRLAV